MATSTRLWQLYDEQGRPLKGQSARKDEVFSKGLLHAAVHVWIWRNYRDNVEVLLQKRSAHKRTWPNRLDISTAGHIFSDTDPVTTALHETNEEIGLQLQAEDLELFDMHRAHLIAPSGAVENEFQFLFLHQLQGEPDFTLQMSIVDSLFWKPLEIFIEDCNGDSYVSHGALYYQTVIEAIKTASQQS
jgi:isopentenyl-diphosphate Delta-isomerase